MFPAVKVLPSGTPPAPNVGAGPMIGASIPGNKTGPTIGANTPPVVGAGAPPPPPLGTLPATGTAAVVNS